MREQREFNDGINPFSYMKHPSPSSGFTLIELLVTVAVAAVLLAIAAPSFQTLMASSRLTTKTNELVTSLTLARSEAIRKGTRVVVCRSSDGSTCASTGDWSVGWMVFEDADSDAVKDVGETVLSAYADSTGEPKVAGNSSAAAAVWFSPDGRAGVTGTIRVCHTFAPLSNDRRARDISITTTGRIATGAPSGIANTCPDPS